MDHVPDLDVDTFSMMDSSPPRDALALDELLVSLFQMQTKRRRQAVAVHGRPWSSLALPSGLMAPAAHDGHGGDKICGDDGYIGQSGNSSCGDGRRGPAGWQQKRREGTTCGLCRTRETPQWRAGPDGPGTLCNACGIRYMIAGDKYIAEHGHRRFRSPDYGELQPGSPVKPRGGDKAQGGSSGAVGGLAPDAGEVPRQ